MPALRQSRGSYRMRSLLHWLAIEHALDELDSIVLRKDAEAAHLLVLSEAEAVKLRRIIGARRRLRCRKACRGVCQDRCHADMSIELFVALVPSYPRLPEPVHPGCNGIENTSVKPSHHARSPRGR